MRHGKTSLAALIVAVVVWFLPTSAIAVDPSTKEAIQQSEEGLRETRRAIKTPTGAPVPAPSWWGWPAYPYPQAPGAPYPQMPQPSASPYPIPVNPAGRVLILVNPVDAEVYVDGVRLQQQADLSYEIGLLAGPHHLQVRKEGFQPYSQRLEIVPGSGLYLPIALEK